MFLQQCGDGMGKHLDKGISEIQHLIDLTKYRTAPNLSKKKKKNLLNELQPKIFSSDWITVGIMANNDSQALNALKSIKNKFPLVEFMGLEGLKAPGKVFLKGNQKTGNVFIRSENGLGEGILLTCQYEDKLKDSNTYGPFPLNFFKN